MKLFHASEDPNIEKFIPLPAPNPEAEVEGNAVWAITDYELPNYLLPRECPRVCFRNRDGEKVITIEEGWVERIKAATLYLYVFSSEKFEELDPIAGYWISRETIIPEEVVEIIDIFNELKKRDLTLKIESHLHNERERVIANYEHFSIIRFRNAAPKS